MSRRGDPYGHDRNNGLEHACCSFEGWSAERQDRRRDVGRYQSQFVRFRLAVEYAYPSKHHRGAGGCAHKTVEFGYEWGELYRAGMLAASFARPARLRSARRGTVSRECGGESLSGQPAVRRSRRRVSLGTATGRTGRPVFHALG